MTRRRRTPCLRLALALLVGVVGTCGAGADDGVAILSAATGAVDISRRADPSWSAAQAGAVLYAGDRLRAGEGAKATLLLGSGRNLAVLPNSLVTFTAEMGADGAAASGFGRALRDLWNAVMGKFTESKDISVAKGVVGTVRAPKKPVKDAGLTDETAKELAGLLEDLESLPDGESFTHFMLAVLFEEWKQYARAEEGYLKSIELDPLQGMPYDALGALYAEFGQKEKLEELIQRKKGAGAVP